jgi:hypothetical protein
MSSKTTVVVERTAKELDKPEYLINQVVASFFEVVVKDIESETYKGSYCRRLGKFVIKPNRLKMLKEKKDGNTIRDSRREGTDTTEFSNDTRVKDNLE